MVPVTALPELGLPSHLFFYTLIMKHSITDDQNIFKRKSRLVKNLIISLCTVCVVSIVSFFITHFVQAKFSTSPTFYILNKEWKTYDYSGVYETSRLILQKKPFNNKALTYHGYASFYLGVSQLDTSLAQNYLDESINCIRLSMLSARRSLIPQLEYMLGKAYFYKNTISSYYYSDLAVKYLLLAKKNGYKADDISEYLGLSYASLDMTMDSISAFTEALLIRESDTLLLSIAEQYYKAGQKQAAEQYLFRIASSSKNSELILKSRVLLGTIYIDEEKYSDAENEFNAVLEKKADSADAYYELGILYEKEGDLVKARAQWRNALHIQVNHAGALKKMAEYK